MKYGQVGLLLAAATLALGATWAADPTPASAQQQPAVAVGVVNADKIIQDCKAGKSLKAQADQRQKAIKADFDKQQKLFDDAAQKLVAQKDSLSPEDLLKKKEDLRRQGDLASKSLNDRQHDLDRSIAKTQDQIVQALVDVVKDVAKAHGLTLVVSRSVTPYFDASYDISPEVMQKLNDKLPSIKLVQASEAQ